MHKWNHENNNQLNKYKNIIIIESSSIIYEGLANILMKISQKYQLTQAGSLEEANRLLIKKRYDIVIVNPLFIFNNIKSFNEIKCQYSSIKWVGLIYSYFDLKLLSLFDGTISISDSHEAIFSFFSKLNSNENQQDQVSSQEILSEREIDVLKLLAKGMANKEIASRLNISTNTVITHRKNISIKTGIKSISGLTIYAVVQKLVSIENLSD